MLFAVLGSIRGFFSAVLRLAKVGGFSRLVLGWISFTVFTSPLLSGLFATLPAKLVSIRVLMTTRTFASFHGIGLLEIKRIAPTASDEGANT
jgi:hypothetical protein